MVGAVYKHVPLLAIIAVSLIAVVVKPLIVGGIGADKVDEGVLRNLLVYGYSEFLVISNDLTKTYNVVGTSALRVFKEFDTILALGDLNLINRLANEPGVVKIVPNFVVRAHMDSAYKVLSMEDGELRETLYSWGRSRIGSKVVEKVYNISGSGIVVAVLDTGISLNHDELKGKLVTINPLDEKYPGGWIEFDRKGMPICSVPRDTHFHGTWVSSIIAGEHIGVAPNVKLMHALVLHGGEGTAAQVLAGLEWALQPYTCTGIKTWVKPNVVSLSLGTSGNYSDVFLKPISKLIEENVVVVASIGNDGPGTTSNPGNVWGVVGVGALNRNDGIADFSSSEVVEWPSPPTEWPFKEEYPKNYIKPDFVAPGVLIPGAYVINGYYLIASGTSASAPMVSGVVALVLEALKRAGKEYTVDEVYDILNRTSDKSCNVSRCGWGVVNAVKAVSYALGRKLDEIEVKVDNEKVHVQDTLTLKSKEDVTFFIDDSELGSGTTLAVNVPILDSGYHFIHSVGEGTYGYAKFFVDPKVHLRSRSLVRGEDLELTLLGFPGASEVLIYLNDNLLTYQTLNLLGFRPMKLLLPYLNPGTYNLLIICPGSDIVIREDVHVHGDVVSELGFTLTSLAPPSQHVNSTVHIYVISLINGSVKEPRRLWYEFLSGKPSTVSDMVKIADGIYCLSYVADTPGMYVVLFKGELEFNGDLVSAATAAVTNITIPAVDVKALIINASKEVLSISSDLDVMSARLAGLESGLQTVNASHTDLLDYVTHKLSHEILYLEIVLTTTLFMLITLNVVFIKYLKRRR